MKPSRTNSGLTLAELAAKIEAEIEGDDSVVIKAVAPIEAAGRGDLSFVANAKYEKFIETTDASALILGPNIECRRVSVLRHRNPYLAFARAVRLLYPDEPLISEGIHPTAVIESGAQVATSARIGPLCHLREGSSVGENSQLLSSIFIGREVTIGSGCLIYPGVRIMDGCRVGKNVIIHSGTVIGSDGFGFAESERGLEKIKQVGWVEVEDDVEIGSNVSIDRGAIGPTRIGRGTKIDNLVQIAHNVQVGEHSIIVSQVGISGSTKIGRGVILAGQVGLIGHIDIGDGVRVGAQSGVTKSIPPGQTWFGSPAREMSEAARIEAALRKLPELLKRVRQIEKKLPEESGD